MHSLLPILALLASLALAAPNSSNVASRSSSVASVVSRSSGVSSVASRSSRASTSTSRARTSSFPTLTVSSSNGGIFPSSGIGTGTSLSTATRSVSGSNTASAGTGTAIKPTGLGGKPWSYFGAANGTAPWASVKKGRFHGKKDNKKKEDGASKHDEKDDQGTRG
ncbi:hypothetical protein EJ08DRAFT_692033 [Tothia fuscella]|uniref:Uncharacterized protein n=1 Tax=Tothia fuscella TaxID=1048955 RepID=A0A9P4P0V6_9PEZI|nr:hypothetical protein EJ08DRAFT_692033 [Tothia fuscella]